MHSLSGPAITSLTPICHTHPLPQATPHPLTNLEEEDDEAATYLLGKTGLLTLLWEFQDPLRGNFSFDRDLPVKLPGREESELGLLDVEDR